MTTLTTPEALAVLDAAAEHYLPTESDGGTTEADMREARAHLASRIAELEAELAAVRAFLANDSLAVTFQSLGQYRTAALDAAREGK